VIPDEILFYFSSPIQIFTIYPTRFVLPWVEGIISVTGSGFYQPEVETAQSWGCWFDSQRYTKAQVVSKTLLLCPVPQYHATSFSTSWTFELTYPGHELERIPTERELVVLPPILLFSRWPQASPAQQGSLIQMRMRNELPANERYECIFGSTNHTTQGFVVNNTHFACNSPQLDETGLVSLLVKYTRVFLNVYPGFHLSHHFYKPVRLESLEPSVIYATKKSFSLIIYGTGFENNPQLSCNIVDRTTSRVRWISSRSIECVIPQNMIPRSYTVRVSNNGFDFNTLGLKLQILPPFVIKSYLPVKGSGSLVTVLGKRFHSDIPLWCRFGNIGRTIATILNQTVVQCNAPFTTRKDQVPLHICDNLDTCVSPGGFQLDQIQQVSSSDNRSESHRIKDARLIEAFPEVVGDSGESSVEVRGVGFPNSYGLRCEFVGKKIGYTQALWISDIAVTCKVPFLEPGKYTLQLTVHGNNFTSINGITIEVVSSPSIISISPTFGLISGGTLVTIRGRNLIPSRQNYSVFCIFGFRSVLAHSILDSRNIQCRAPPSNCEGNVTVTVEISHSLRAVYPSGYYYIHPLTIESVFPTIVHQYKPVEITLDIDNLPPFMTNQCLRCKLDDIIGKIQIMTSNSLTCSVVNNTSTAGLVAISIIDEEGHILGLKSDSVHTIKTPIVIGVSQKWIISPSLEDSILFVEGEHFPPIEGIYCEFDNKYLGQALVLGPSLVKCQPPTLSSGRHQVKIKTGGLEDVNEGADFDVWKPFRIFSLEPQCGPPNSFVILNGENFLQSSNIYCDFDGFRAEANVIDNNTLSCIIPNSLPDGEVSISLKKDNYRLSLDFRPFYVTSLVVSSVFPTIGSPKGGTRVIMNLARPLPLYCNVFCYFGSFIEMATKSIFGNETDVLICKSPSMPDAVSSIPIGITTNEKSTLSSPFLFNFRPEPIIDNFMPRKGSLGDGSLLVIRGKHFYADTNLACKFGSNHLEVFGIWLSSDTFVCETPPNLLPGPNLLLISINLVDYIDTGLYYQVSAKPTISLISPHLSFVGDHVNVTLFGRGFEYGDWLTCRVSYESQLIPALFINQNEIMCPLPPTQRSGNVTLKVSNNGVDLVDAPDEIQFIYHPRIFSIEPVSIPCSGGTKLSVTFDNTINGTDILCSFGTHVTSTTLHDDFTVKCEPPKVTYIGSAQFSLIYSGLFIRAQQSIHYYRDPALHYIFPASGARTLEHAVTLIGEYFAPESCLCCMLGNTAIAMTLISSKKVLCHIPSEINVGNYLISLSSDCKRKGINKLRYSVYSSVDAHMRGESDRSGMLELKLAKSNYFEIEQYQNKLYSSEDIESPNSIVIDDTGKGVYGAKSMEKRHKREAPKAIRSADLQTPEFGPSFIRIRGKGIPFSSSLSCKFDDEAVQATLLKNDTILCNTPYSLCNSDSCVQPNNCAVSLDGKNFTKLGRSPYYFYPVPKVLAFSPVRGPSDGGTSVSIQIDGLPDQSHHQIKCRFGYALVMAVVDSSSSLSCTSAPKFDSDSFVNLQISINAGVDWSLPGEAFFEYYPEAHLMSISPLSGLFTGGYMVELEGSNFMKTVDFSCVFGKQRSPKVVWVSSTKVFCEVPYSSKLGYISVAVSINGVDVSQQSVAFEYRSAPSVLAVHPQSLYFGLATDVTLIGRDFDVDSTYYCKIGNSTLNSTLVLNTELRFRFQGVLQPEIGLIDTVSVNFYDSNHAQLSSMVFKVVEPPNLIRAEHHITSKEPVIYIIGHHMNTTGEAWCIFRPHNYNPPSVLPGLTSQADVLSDSLIQCIFPFIFESSNINVFVSTNGLSLSKMSLTVKAPRLIRVSSAIPMRGPVSGGTDVVIWGQNFSLNSYLMCWFGSEPTIASVISPNQLTCKSPGISNPQAVRLEIGTVERKEISNYVVFYYTGPIEISQKSCADSFLSCSIPVRQTYQENFLEWFESQDELGSSDLLNDEGEILRVRQVEERNQIGIGTELHPRFNSVAPVAYFAEVSYQSNNANAFVHIYGFRFHNEITLACFFEFPDILNHSHAVWVSSTQVVCSVPSTLHQYVGVADCFFVILAEYDNIADSSQSSFLEIPIPVLIQSSSDKRFPKYFHTVPIDLPFERIPTTEETNEYVLASNSTPSHSVEKKGAPTIRSIYPYEVPAGENVTIGIIGKNFLDEMDKLLCFFDKTSLPCAILSPWKIACTIPNLDPGQWNVSVSWNAMDFSNSLDIRVYRPPKLIELSPKSGPTIGGTEVKVYMTNHVHTRASSCFFGQDRSMALFSEQGVYVCLAPAKFREGVVEVSITVNGNDLYGRQRSTNFTYFNDPTFSKDMATYGHLRSSGTISLSGQNSDDEIPSKVCCQFQENILSNAWVVNLNSYIHAKPPDSNGGEKDHLNPLYYFQDRYTSPLQFEYKEISFVDHVTPSSGVSAGGTRIEVFGQGFVNSHDLVCSFGLVSVRASFQSQRMVICRSPENDVIGEVKIAVTSNSSEKIALPSPTAFFRYYLPPQVTHVSPDNGLAHGGTLVQIYGFGFPGELSSEITCRFGNVPEIISALWVDSTQIRCASPQVIDADEIGIPQKIGISLNGQDYTTSRAALFTFLPIPRLLSISPTFGWHNVSTDIKIDFLWDFPVASFFERFDCLFFESDDEIISASTLFVTESGYFCITPKLSRNVEHTIGVMLRFDGHRIEYSTRLFRYVFERIVSSFSPAIGSFEGGTEVVFLGEGFIFNDDVDCIFGEQSSPYAYIQSSTQLVCITPKANLYEVSGYGVKVGVTLNGVGYYFFQKEFRYTFPPVASHLWPDSLPCNKVHPITIYGQQLGQVSSCRFGRRGATIPALSVADSQVVCSPPHLHTCIDEALVVYLSFDGVLKDMFLTLKILSVINTSETFAKRPRLLHVMPSFAQSSGEEPLHVFGYDFEVSNKTGCIFGSQYTPARVLSSSEIICLSPRMIPSVTQIRVINGLSNLTSDLSLNVTIQQDIRLYDASPDFGSVYGGTLVTLTGVFHRLENPSSFVCQFGTLMVHAESVTFDKLKCRAPSLPFEAGGLIPLKVSCNGGITFAKTTLSYSYEPSADVYEVYPSFVPAKGRVSVLVKGGKFKKVRTLTCKIGDSRSVAVFLSSELVRCTVPPGSQALKLQVFVSNNGQDFGFSSQYLNYYQQNVYLSDSPYFGSIEGGSHIEIREVPPNHIHSLQCKFAELLTSSISIGFDTECIVPALPIGNTPLTLCVECGTMQEQILYEGSFLTVPEPSIVSFWPRHGTKEGNWLVFIKGANFVSSPNISCKIGDHISRATMIHSTVVTCRTPPAQHVGEVAITISLNGFDFSKPAFEKLKYLSTSSLFGSIGAEISFHVPNGTYFSSSFAINNFTACEPGTFQPSMGKKSCLLCPVGHSCPDLGMSKPIACESGWVCDDVGLIWPLIKCPRGYYCEKGTKSSKNPELSKPNFNMVTNGSHGTIISSNLVGIPVSCPIGYYCLEGVGTSISITENIFTPQICFDGFFCQIGSFSPEGAGPCQTGYFCPSTALAVPCPIGNFCPSVGNTKALPCHPGSFQNSTGRGSCNLCEFGHFCPSWGMTVALPCPAGYVCDSLGLSNPSKPCPAGLVCNRGTSTINPDSGDGILPSICPEGKFCLQGVALNHPPFMTNFELEIISARECMEGYYCSRQSGTPSGNGPCWTGHYCPPGTAIPIKVPAGTFSSSPGAIVPSLCLPGHYSPAEGSIECRICPIGFSCGSYGVSVPRKCGMGSYRSHSTDTACISCPPGTYASYTASSDMTLCLPCPPGVVCGLTRTSDISTGNFCTSGYVCGASTNIRTQYNHESSGGYFSAAGASPKSLFQYPCDSGYVCERGTPKEGNSEIRCSTNYFCPKAASMGSEEHHRCPRQTLSQIGSVGLENCNIEMVDICDKLAADGNDPSQNTAFYTKESSGKQNLWAFAAQSIKNQVKKDTRHSELSASVIIDPIKTLNEDINLWINETVEVFRSCPSYGRLDDIEKITIFGRNFRNTTQLACRFSFLKLSTVGDSLIRSATYISATRVECPIDLIMEDMSALLNKTELSASGPLCQKNDRDETFLFHPCLASNRIQFGCVEASDGSNETFRPTKAFFVPCSEDDNHQHKCHNIPLHGMHINPCLTKNIRIEISNNGKLFSGQSIVIPKSQIVGEYVAQDYDDFSIDGTYAVFSHLKNPDFSSKSQVGFMDQSACKRMSYYEEGPWSRDATWISLSFLQQAQLRLDWRHIPDYLEYNKHYKLAIYVRPSRCGNAGCDTKGLPNYRLDEIPCSKPMVLPTWFEDSRIKKQGLLNVTIQALDDLIFKVQVHMLHNIAVATSEHFKETVIVTITSPQRAKEKSDVELLDHRGTTDVRSLSPYVSLEQRLVDKEYFFATLYTSVNSENIGLPLNLPPRWGDFEKGRALLAMNASKESNLLTIVDDSTSSIGPNLFWNNPFVNPVEAKLKTDLYFETFHGVRLSKDNNYSYSLNGIILPYIPFLSNCNEFDSYITFWALVEAPQCQLPPISSGQDATWWRRQFPALPHRDDLRVVGPLDFRKFYPIADWCHRKLHCSYEETLGKLDSTPRWFEASTGTSLFSFVRDPVDFGKFTGRNRTQIGKDDGGGAKWLSTVNTPDVFIPVKVDREAALQVADGCEKRCFPRRIRFEVGYYQVSNNMKSIIDAKMVLLDFDKDSERKDYSVDMSFRPLDYQELIIKFAFGKEIFIIIFIVMGLFMVVVVAIFWSSVRLTTQIEVPPGIRFFGMARLIVPDAIAGFLLGSFPILLISLLIGLFFRGESFLDFTAVLKDYQSDSKTKFLQDVYDLSKVQLFASNQKGRSGLAFVVMALLAIHEGSHSFVPSRLSRLEEEAQQREGRISYDKGWTPITWKRSNFKLSCCIAALVLVVIIEWSFWENYGRYIWEAILLLKVFSISMGFLVDNQVHEMLLGAPIGAALGVVQIIVTLSAEDFLDFLLSRIIYLGFTIFDRMFLSPYQPVIFAWIKLKFSLFVQVLLDFLDILSPKMFRKMASTYRTKTVAENAKEKDALTVEPIISSLSSYFCEQICLFCAPFVICFVMLFWDETEIPALYHIKEHDMEQYLIFSFIIVPFQLICDIFLHNALELFYGWKIHDYLGFIKLKFQERELRWRGMEVDSLDESIDETVRSIEQMCFSSQYFMILSVQACGIVYLAMGIEIMLRAEYNFFKDPLMPGVILFVAFICKLLREIFYRLGLLFKVWKPKAAYVIWNVSTRENDQPPDYSDIEGVDFQEQIMNERMMAESFRHKFLIHNRNWLIENLPTLLTPRTIKRARPFLTNQFSRILSAANPNISDESDDDDSIQFRMSQLSKTSALILKDWRKNAQRRIRMEESVIAQTLRARKDYCEKCLSRGQLKAEPLIAIEELEDSFISDHGGQEFNKAAWKRHWELHQRYQTLCSVCRTKLVAEEKVKLALKIDSSPSAARVRQDVHSKAVPGMNPVRLDNVSEGILKRWRDIAQRRLIKCHEKQIHPNHTKTNCSADEPKPVIENLELDVSSKTIAIMWLRTARISIHV